MKILNIYVDETGEFGFHDKSSKLYGISFTFHEQDNDISNEINNLNARLKKIGYTGMIHMADLIMKRGDYVNFDINMRREIFKVIFHFSRKVPIKIYSIIVNKKYTDNKKVLKQKLLIEINKMLIAKETYFKKFTKINLYYDNGQELLGTILDSAFLKFSSFAHIINFDHEKERLFQVSDMLTYIDKYDYKYKNKIPITKIERYFFSENEMRKIIWELNKKRIL